MVLFLSLKIATGILWTNVRGQHGPGPNESFLGSAPPGVKIKSWARILSFYIFAVHGTARVCRKKNVSPIPVRPAELIKNGFRHDITVRWGLDM